MVFSTKIYRLLQQVEPGLRDVLIALLEEMERQREQWEQSVTKTEFNELKEIVRELAEAQKEFAEAQRKSEHRISRLEKAVEELTEAQKRTEQRVEELAKSQKELTEAQKRTEDRVSKLEKIVEELAEAQKKTEQRVEELAQAQKKTEQRVSRLEKVVEELAEAQKKTEQRVEELAQAQKRTEQEIEKLTGELRLVKERLEGVSHSVGYSLENRSYKALPPLLKRDMGIEVKTPLIRKYIELPKGKIFQANIYGLAKKDGKEVVILGECKVRPSKKEVRRFLSKVKQFSDAEGKEVVPIIVAHDFPPDMEKYLKEQGIKYYWSYELE